MYRPRSIRSVFFAWPNPGAAARTKTEIKVAVRRARVISMPPFCTRSSVLVQILLRNVVLRHLAGADFFDVLVRSILHSVDRVRFQILPLFDQLLDALVPGFGLVGQPLGIPGLPARVRPSSTGFR